MSAINHDPMFKLDRKRSTRFERIFGAVAFGASTLALGAYAWSALGPGADRAPETTPIAMEVAAADAGVAAPDSPIQAEPEAVTAAPETIAAERIVVALESDEAELDYVAVATEKVEAGELEAAFVALRKHLYRHEPTPEVLLEVGRLGRQIGEHAIAEQALADAGALDPANGEIQAELARTLLEVGELEDARVHARHAIRLDPDSALAWNLAGRVAMKQSHWTRAESALRRAVELDPMNAMIHNNLGLLYVHMGKATDAVDSLETAVELFDDEAPYFVFNNLGLAHEMAGHAEDAQGAFEQALVLNPDYARAKLNLDRVTASIAAREGSSAYETAKEDVAEGHALRP